jgi:hypothetical protein
MLAIVVEDGTGKADANSYATIEEADERIGESTNGATWGAAPVLLRTQCLIMATRVIDACYQFRGKKTFPDRQALEWPRTGNPSMPDYEPISPTRIPPQLKTAIIEAAYVFSTHAPDPLYNADASTLKSKLRSILPIVTQSVMSDLGRFKGNGSTIELVR